MLYLHPAGVCFFLFPAPQPRVISTRKKQAAFRAHIASKPYFYTIKASNTEAMMFIIMNVIIPLI